MRNDRSWSTKVVKKLQDSDMEWPCLSETGEMLVHCEPRLNELPISPRTICTLFMHHTAHLSRIFGAETHSISRDEEVPFRVMDQNEVTSPKLHSHSNDPAQA